MPIYEFYCPDCHALLNFFSASVDTESRPDCPRCGHERLERRPARFATPRSRPGEDGAPDDPFAGLDDARLESVMGSLADEMGSAEEREDPRTLARLLRRFGDASGLEPGPRLEEALARLERGEDPDTIEEEMGDALDGDDDPLGELFRLKRQAKGGDRRRPPRVDDELYFL